MFTTFIIILVNAAIFCVYAIDKKHAQNSVYPISERTLLLLTALGGALGAHSCIATIL